MKLPSLPVLALLAGLAAPLPSQGSILPYLPKDTIVAVAAPDLTTSLAQMQAMPIAKMWNEEETQNFVADLMDLAKAKWDEHMAQAKEMHKQGALPFDPEQLTKLRVNACTLALTQLQISVGDFGPQPKIGIVIHVDFGDTAPIWAPLIQMGLSTLGTQAGPEVAKTESKVGEWALTTFSQNSAQGNEMSLNVVQMPNGILLGTLTEDLQAIADSMQKKTPALAATEAYAAVAKHLTTDGAEIEMYSRLDPLIQFAVDAVRIGSEMNPAMQDVDMEGVARAIDAMGWNNLGAGGMTSNYVDGKAVTKGYWVHPTGSGTTAAAKTIDTSFLKWVPKDAAGFSASTFDVMSIYDTLLKGLQAYDAEKAKEVLAQLAEIEKQLGFKVRDDFFGAIGDHYISWSMPMATLQQAPETAFLVKVNDEQKLVTVMKSLAKLSNGAFEIDEAEKRGVKVYQLRMNLDPNAAMGMNMIEPYLQPCFSFKNGYMVVAFAANDVRRTFQRMDREDDPKGDIRSNKEYAAVASQIPAGVDSLSFTDYKAQFESVYGLASGALALIPLGEDVPINTALVPMSENLTKHLFGGVSWTKSDAGGTESVSIGPFGPEVMAIAGGAIALGIGWVAGTRASGF